MNEMNPAPNALEYPQNIGFPPRTNSTKNTRSKLEILLALALAFVPVQCFATTLPDGVSALCDSAAHQASQESGVPSDVMRAISLTETGRKRSGKMLPWPWTVNMEGKGEWFDDADSARAYVYDHYKRGARSFDVGCFQINFKWHGDAFSSIEEMFDPLTNARYAAKFLRELYAETGNWKDAAGAYHSRTTKYADLYKKRFEAFRARLADSPVPSVPLPLSTATELVPSVAPFRVARANLYPLLQGRIGGSTPGSLVPLAPMPGARRLIDIPLSD